jgi:DNA-binding GntR family transcriptional regulator
LKESRSGAGRNGGAKPAHNAFHSPTRLQAHVANELLELVRAKGMRIGDPLREEAFAAQLSVSRTSIRGALRILGAQGLLEARPRKGYVLKRNATDILQEELPTSSDERLYFQIARDYLAKRLPESNTETELMRRYKASRHLVLAALALLSEEGIIHRGKGREWRFRDVLTSSRARGQSYELRTMIEPAALLLPSFETSRFALEAMREVQERLQNSVEARASHREVFQADASFHELLAQLSGNAFVLATVRQHNRVRRLLEYQSNLDAARVRTWCREHISVIDALLAGDRSRAAVRLRQHLENARRAANSRQKLNPKLRAEGKRRLSPAAVG